MTPSSVLRDVFGYEQFRGQQQAIVETLCAGQDALVLMPTGGGKSLCFQIPALLRPGVAVVVSPLIALMEDQVAALRQLDVRAALLNSSLSQQEQGQVERQMRNGELDIVYIAPERLTQPRCMELLQSCDLSLFAIDEAHCVSQWGHDFRPEYMQLSVLAERFPGIPRIALTATADLPTREEIAERLQLQQARRFVHSFDRPNICYRVAERGGGRDQLLQFIRDEHPEDAGIVYCLSRNKVDKTAEWLCSKGLDALPYHAGLDHPTRTAHQRRFLNEEGVIIVATIAFGMGIDKPNVRFVAHLDLPASVEAYYQETGRAGRDAAAANAWMLYGLNDVVQRRQMIEKGDAGEVRKRVERHKLDAMLSYCEVSSCRRQNLLQYFGEVLPEPCGNCDTCLSPPATWDATKVAQKVLSAVYRTGQRFGSQYIIRHLLGEEDERASSNGHDQLTTWGIGRELQDRQWRSVIRQLIALDYLNVDLEGYGGLRLGENSRDLLKGQISLRLRHDREPEKKKKSRGKAGTLKAGDSQLWEALRGLRKQLATEQGVPPYVIFHDATLMQMIEALPDSDAAFLALTGVSEKKLQAYGEAFMAVIRDHADALRVPDGMSTTSMASVRACLQGSTAAEIAAKRELTETTVLGHLARGIEQGLLKLEQAVEISPQARREIESALSECDAMTSEAPLKAVYERLGSETPYGLIRCVQAAALSQRG